MPFKFPISEINLELVLCGSKPELQLWFGVEAVSRLAAQQLLLQQLPLLLLLPKVGTSTFVGQLGTFAFMQRPFIVGMETSFVAWGKVVDSDHNLV